MKILQTHWICSDHTYTLFTELNRHNRRFVISRSLYWQKLPFSIEPRISLAILPARNQHFLFRMKATTRHMIYGMIWKFDVSQRLALLNVGVNWYYIATFLINHLNSHQNQQQQRSAFWIKWLKMYLAAQLMSFELAIEWSYSRFGTLASKFETLQRHRMWMPWLCSCSVKWTFATLYRKTSMLIIIKLDRAVATCFFCEWQVSPFFPTLRASHMIITKC